MSYAFEGGLIKHNGGVIGAVTSKSFTVPVGRTWLLLAAAITRDQAATLAIEVYDGVQLILVIDAFGAAANSLSFPTNSTSVQSALPWGTLKLKGGWIVKYTFGVAQTNPYCDLIVKEY